MASVTFDRATRHFATMDRPAVSALELQVADGEFMVLVGPSGCGKSTALRMLAGLEPVDSGAILIGDTDVTRRPSRDRDVAMVVQDYALYPHLTAEDNIGFPLLVQNVPKDAAQWAVTDIVALLDARHYLGRKPKSLSAGQRQRVATGRALVREPQALLMDEPLSNLDAGARVRTRAHIASLQRLFGITTLYVTHDQAEALSLGDRVAVLDDGVLQQVGTPREVYAYPANVFVAGFIGSPPMNLLRLPLTLDGTAQLGGLFLPLPRPALEAARAERLTEIVLGIRPEEFDIVSVEDRETPGLDLVIDALEYTGASLHLHTVIGVHRVGPRLVVRAPQRAPYGEGHRMRVTVHPDAVHVFSGRTGLRLPIDGEPA
ncbi:ABC transporter ATP-binding protein [Streptomyces sp. R21]|uniref:ABC transporter ATP-binding protein n=1 Tax=Streptomyces sp. R21 TaxID=3238627 RepID=A0AB39PLW8_9ACTN